MIKKYFFMVFFLLAFILIGSTSDLFAAKKSCNVKYGTTPSGKKCICKIKKTKKKKSTKSKNHAGKKHHATKTKKSTSKKSHTDAHKKAVVKPTNSKSKPSTGNTAPNKSQAAAKVANNSANLNAEQKSTEVVADQKKAVILLNNTTHSGVMSASVNGVVYSIDSHIKTIDLSNDFKADSSLEAAYKLFKFSSHWPKSTVFVASDGMKDSFLLAKAKNGQYFIVQNDGALSFIENQIGLEAVRNLQRVNFKSETLSKKDVEYSVAARLLSNKIAFDKLGESYSLDNLTKLSYKQTNKNQDVLSGFASIEGNNVETLISYVYLQSFNPKENDYYDVKIYDTKGLIYHGVAEYHASASYLPQDEAVITSASFSYGKQVVIKNIKDVQLPEGFDNYIIEITPTQDYKAGISYNNTEQETANSVATETEDEQELSLDSKAESDVKPNKTTPAPTPKDVETEPKSKEEHMDSSHNTKDVLTEHELQTDKVDTTTESEEMLDDSDNVATKPEAPEEMDAPEPLEKPKEPNSGNQISHAPQVVEPQVSTEDKTSKYLPKSSSTTQATEPTSTIKETADVQPNTPASTEDSATVEPTPSETRTSASAPEDISAEDDELSENIVPLSDLDNGDEMIDTPVKTDK